MARQQLMVTGSWIDVIGLLTSAIGKTRSIREVTAFNHKLIVIGEGLRVLGDALLAIETTNPLLEVGEWIQLAGSGTSSLGAYLHLADAEEEGMNLELLGNSLQALGSAIAAEAESDEFLSIASKLNSIGAILEAIGMSTRIKGLVKKGTTFNALGSWIQAAGGTLKAILLTRELKNQKQERRERQTERHHKLKKHGKRKKEKGKRKKIVICSSE